MKNTFGILALLLIATSQLGWGPKMPPSDRDILIERLKNSPFKDATYYCATKYAHIALYPGSGEFETHDPVSVVNQKNNRLVIQHDGDAPLIYSDQLYMIEDGAGQLSANLVVIDSLGDIFESIFSLYYEHEGAHLAGEYAFPKKRPIKNISTMSSHNFHNYIELNAGNNMCGPYTDF